MGSLFACGTISEPDKAGPSMLTARPLPAGAICRRVSGKLEPSNSRRSVVTSIWRNGMPSPLLPPFASAIHSSASSEVVCPPTTSPDAGGTAFTTSLPSTTCTPVCCPLARARKASNLPKATSIWPLPIGMAVCTVVGSATNAGLSKGAGSLSVVPTRSERSFSLPGTLLSTGNATPTVHEERPCP